MGDDYQMATGWIDLMFDPSPANQWRDEVANLLPNLKSVGTFLDIGNVIERLDRFCRGGFYSEGGEPPSLRRTYPALSDDEKARLNEHYLRRAKEFETSLAKSQRKPAGS